MASTVHRRHSMAQLYEKLRAQGDDDDMAWLAQYSPDDTFDEPYVPAARTPPALSAVSSASPVSSCSSASSIFDPGFDNESSDDHLDFDSDYDVDPLDISCTAYVTPPSSPLIPQPGDINAMGFSDPSYSPSVREVSPPESISSVESGSPPVQTLPVHSIASRRTTRSVRNSSGRSRSPANDAYEDVYSESDGNGSEDEYIPSPTLGPRKRHRSCRSAPSVTSSRKRTAQDASRKRPRHSPLPRNAQAAAGITSASPVAKTNQWACPYCKWVQRNHRTPDLKRHIRTHTRLQRPAQWVCCGVPVEDARYHNVPKDAEPYFWGGEEMIGGCCKEFSRRDALKRHLDNDHIHCVGNFAAFANICEDENYPW